MQLLCFLFGCITSIALFYAYDCSIEVRTLRQSNEKLYKENFELYEKVRSLHE